MPIFFGLARVCDRCLGRMRVARAARNFCVQRGQPEFSRARLPASCTRGAGSVQGYCSLPACTRWACAISRWRRSAPCSVGCPRIRVRRTRPVTSMRLARPWTRSRASRLSPAGRRPASLGAGHRRHAGVTSTRPARPARGVTRGTQTHIVVILDGNPSLQPPQKCARIDLLEGFSRRSFRHRGAHDAG